MKKENLFFGQIFVSVLLWLSLLACGGGGGGSPADLPGGSTTIDTTPDSFSFSAQSDVELSTAVTSDSITVSGIDAATSISISGADGEYAIDGGSFTSSAGTVTNGQSVVVRVTSAGDYSTPVETTLTIGGVSATFRVTTREPDTTPEAFTFTDQSDVDPNTSVTSNTITITGIEVPVEIAIAGADGEYSIDGGSFTSGAGTVANGQTVAVRVTSSSDYMTAVETTLTVGGVSDIFSVTTREPNTTPLPFSFPPVEEAELNTVTLSNYVTIQGTEAPAPISISGADAEYRIDGEAFTSAPGTIPVGGSVQVRLTSASEPATRLTATLTIGELNVDFVVTTKRWGDALRIDNEDSGYAITPQVGVDDNGNAIAIWTEYDGSVYNLWSNRFDASTKLWGTPVLLDTEDVDNVYTPSIKVDSQGNAIVVWFQRDGVRDNVWYNRFNVSDGSWGVATKLESDDGGNSKFPLIEMNDNGDAMVSWIYDNSVTSEVKTRYFKASTNTWGNVQSVQTLGFTDAYDEKVAISNNGDAAVLFFQTNGTVSGLYLNRYDSASESWQGAGVIDLPNTSSLNRSYHFINMDEVGNILTTLVYKDNANSTLIFNNYYDKASNSWGGLTLAHTIPTQDIYWNKIIKDSAGTYVAIWKQDSALWSGRFNTTTYGWEQVAHVVDSCYYDFDFAADSNNNILVTCARENGLFFDMSAIFYDAENESWGNPVVIDGTTSVVSSADNPSMGFDANNNAFVVWNQTTDSSSNIWSNRYIGQ